MKHRKVVVTVKFDVAAVIMAVATLLTNTLPLTRPGAASAAPVFQWQPANASARGQRTAILSSPLHQLMGSCLAVDCLTPGCGERSYSITALAACYGAKQTVSGVLRLMRCAGCGKPVGAAWLVTGPMLNERVRPRRVALLGPEARG